MRHAAALVDSWRAEGRHPALARPIDADGLGPRAVDDLLLVDHDGTTAGALLGGAADATTVAAATALLAGSDGQTIVTVAVSEDAAAAAGLTCGGEARILVQRLDDIDPALWAAFAAGQPAALSSRLDGAGGTLVTQPGAPSVGSLGGADLDEVAGAEAERLLARPGSSAARVWAGEVELLVEGWNPVPRLVIVGAGALVPALTGQAELLGWQAITTVAADEAVAAVGDLTTADMVVVIDHDPRLATPVLAAALGGAVGYVGALGSRRTQEARRRALEAAGVGADQQAALHGPTGLDLGARTPAETAVSIVAEIIAVRSGREPASLRSTAGRISA